MRTGFDTVAGWPTAITALLAAGLFAAATPVAAQSAPAVAASPDPDFRLAPPMPATPGLALEKPLGGGVAARLQYRHFDLRDEATRFEERRMSLGLVLRF